MLFVCNWCVITASRIGTKARSILRAVLSPVYTIQTPYCQISPSFSQVIIVPSQRDACCDFVYPQPPPDLNISSPNLTFASDPCVVEVNGVSLAMTSTDVLFHLSSEEVCYGVLKFEVLQFPFVPLLFSTHFCVNIHRVPIKDGYSVVQYYFTTMPNAHDL